MTQAEIESDYAPRITAAMASAQLRRDEAFIEVPFEVCGLRLRPMAIADYLALIAARNAHITGERPSETEGNAGLRFWALHDAVFLWAVSVDYRPDVEARAAFLRRLSPLPLSKLHEGIAAYLADTFADAPRGSGDANPTQADPLRVSFAAILTHRLAGAYGWSRTAIRAMPLKEVFQHLRILRAEEQLRGGKQPVPCADEADHLWAEMLRQINASRRPAA